jgi:hypothetical protein
MSARNTLAKSGEAFTETTADSPPTGPPAAACPSRTSSARREDRRSRMRRLVGLRHRVPKNHGDCYDPRFERPDLVEDDYYRFRNQPPAGEGESPSLLAPAIRPTADWALVTDNGACYHPNDFARIVATRGS